MAGLKGKLEILVFIGKTNNKCDYAIYMTNIFSAILPYKSHVVINVKDLDSKIAKRMGIRENSIMIPEPPDGDGPLIISDVQELRKTLGSFFGDVRALN